MKKVKTDGSLIHEETNQMDTLNKECEKLSIENTKLQNRIFQLEKSLNAYKESNTINDSNHHIENTSSNSLLKSEFIQLWNEFALVDLINNFIDFENEPKLLFQLIQEMFSIMNELITEYNNYLIKNITEMMRIPNENIIKNILRPVFKEFCLNIFGGGEKNKNYFNYEKFFEKYKNFFDFQLPHTEEQNAYFNEAIESKEFIKMLDHVKFIILFIKYETNQFSLDIQPNFSKREYQIREFSKKNEIIIPFKNFASNKNVNSPTKQSNYHYLILLDPPKHNKLQTDFIGINPIVYKMDIYNYPENKNAYTTTSSLKRKNIFNSNNISSIVVKGNSNNISFDTSGEEGSNEIYHVFKYINKTNIVGDTSDLINQNGESANSKKVKGKTISSIRLDHQRTFNVSGSISYPKSSYANKSIKHKRFNNKINTSIKNNEYKNTFLSSRREAIIQKETSNPKSYTSSNVNIFSDDQRTHSYSKIAIKTNKTTQNFLKKNKNLYEITKLLSTNNIVYANNKSVLIKIKNRKKKSNNTTLTIHKNNNTNEILPTEMNTNSNTVNQTEESNSLSNENEINSFTFTKLKNETRNNNPLFIYDNSNNSNLNHNTNLNSSCSQKSLGNHFNEENKILRKNEKIFKKMNSYTKKSIIYYSKMNHGNFIKNNNKK